MKRFICILMVFAFSACLLSCSKGEEPSGSSSSSEELPVVAPVEKKINPMTGEYTDWEGAGLVRPVSFTINNIYQALPQRGIGSADMIYEMETEGGITRMLAIFGDYTKIPEVGSIRSARHNFFEITRPLNTIFVHFGGSYLAYNYISKNSIQTIDGNYLSSHFIFDKVRNQKKGSEHCWFINAEILNKLVELKKIDAAASVPPALNFTSPRELGVYPTGGSALKIDFSFSSYNPYASLTYDSASGKYLKAQYKENQIDEITGEQLAFKNAFILYTTVTRVNSTDKLVNIDLKSGGEGYYFTLGRMEKITWKKGGETDPFQFFKEDGSPLEVNPGNTYTAIVSKTLKDKTVIS